MVEKAPNSILSGLSGSVAGVREVASRRPRPSSRGTTSSLGGNGGASPGGPRGRRMLSPDTPLESLDNNAARGTYIDILV
ncbi:hypothetical protein [Magnetospirillum molischianum]|uniref:Uncharacterized protein n=1 Tax=Magnetospirillum molischianum DSM 120 TaxID=1150626 RepID=H8FQU3_MAGML|nr:hypothetical protein [Magnetospirillum molischianum]CCG40731.1 conserved hypothetical protein [Magnetospirillum molischianum DSM 120]